MNEEQIKLTLKNEGLSWQDFQKWMIGQGVSEDEKGNTIYFINDILRFMEEKTKKIKLIQNIESIKREIIALGNNFKTNSIKFFVIEKLTTRLIQLEIKLTQIIFEELSDEDRREINNKFCKNCNR